MHSVDHALVSFRFPSMTKKLVLNLLSVFFWCYTYIYVKKVQAINGGVF